MGVQILVIAVILTTVVYGIRYVIYKIFDAGTDAIENAYKHKKDSEAPKEPENLADRYKK